MNWLPLTDYSTKYKVSVSTLRRRIKAEDIKYRFEDGKYLIAEDPADLTSQVQVEEKQHRPSLSAYVNTNSNVRSPSLENPIQVKSTVDQQDLTSQQEPILTAANRLLTELKKAYTQILHEKEEQIIHLKGEVSDLKTLVKVLESENDRLRQLNSNIRQ